MDYDDQRNEAEHRDAFEPGIDAEAAATVPPDAAPADAEVAGCAPTDEEDCASTDDDSGDEAESNPEESEEDAGDEDSPDGDASDEDESDEDAGNPDQENAANPPEAEDKEAGAEGDDADLPSLPIASVIEAILFAAREPLKPAQIARAVGKGTRQDAVRAAVEELNLHYLVTSRSFEIAEISGRFQLMSRPEYAVHIMRIYPKRETADKEKAPRLTPAALDTLAIIAYKQPVTRGEIEHIRGVGCGPVLRALIERGSVKVAGKRTDIVGQPLVYGTTEAFLAEFGLGSLDELPMRNEFLNAFFEPGPAPAPAPAAPPDEPAEETAALDDTAAKDDSPESSSTEAEAGEATAPDEAATPPGAGESVDYPEEDEGDKDTAGENMPPTLKFTVDNLPY